MNLWTKFALGAATIGGAGIATGFTAQRFAMAKADDAFAKIIGATVAPEGKFDPRDVSGLPEIARRYFRHAIAPGTPLYSSAELTMKGLFLLGSKENYQTYRMRARQALGASNQFVWIPSLFSGPVVITGSDALFNGSAWTRFWLFGIVPVANEQASADLVRSAQFRAVMESAIWLPPSLLPGNGVDWHQLSDDTARLTFTRFEPAIEIIMTIDAAGAVKQLVGKRWSNANTEKVFRLQPFGGVVLAESTFEGLTIPSQLAVGNHFGTGNYLPFFQATVTAVEYY